MASLHVASELVKAITNIIYPVGSIYISTNTANPSSYLGGTWQQVAHDCYLIGYNAGNTWFDKPGQNKGSKNGPGSWNTDSHTLTINEIPSHGHKIRMRNEGKWSWNSGSFAGDMLEGGYYWQGSSGTFNWLIDTEPQGRGKGHSHNIPYIAVFAWRRTA